METTHNVKYGLKNIKTGKLVYLEKSENNGGCCGDFTWSLVDYETQHGFWLLDNAEDVNYVVFNSTSWYNSEYETPSHNLDPDEYMIVRRQITIVEDTRYFEPNAYYELLESFIREYYIDGHSNDEIDGMVSRYCKLQSTPVDLSMKEDFDKWLKSRGLRFCNGF